MHRLAVPEFYKYTAFRLFLPLIAGILLGNLLFFEGIQFSYATFLVILFFFSPLFYIVYKKGSSYSLRWLFGWVTFLFFVTWGVFEANLRLRERVVDFPAKESVYRVVITERPEVKERSVFCKAKLLEQRDSVGSKQLNHLPVLLYFALDMAERSIQRGDELLLSTRLSLPKQMGNPDEFDYQKYLIHKGVCGTGFVSSGRWQLVKQNTDTSIRGYALGCRDSILELYREMGFDDDNYALLSALTLGYKEELSESIRESFSVSGASHVLALSGLHIGFLYLLFFFLLSAIPGSSVAMDACRAGVIVILLWGFAFLVGLSPSVVRSVIMFSLLAVSRFFTGRSITINTLCVAGIIMLIANPFWLFDVGFQLSFLAVSGILLIQPRLYGWVVVRNRFQEKLWALITVSIAAQLGTAPLILLCFSRFPVHFLLTNIVVVPLITIAIYMAIALLLLSPIPIVSQVISYGLRQLLNWTITIVRGIESLPFASIDRVWVYRFEVLLIYLFLIYAGWYVATKRPRLLLVCLTIVLSISLYRVYMTEKDCPQQSLIFYNVRNCPVVHCVQPDGQSWLVYADSIPDNRQLHRVASSYWNRLRLSVPTPVMGYYNDRHLIRRDHFFSFGKKRICIINDNRWIGTKSIHAFPVDCVYLCRGYTGSIEQLLSVFTIEQIVLDSSISDYRQRMLQEECQRLEVPLVSLSEQSSYYKRLI